MIDAGVTSTDAHVASLIGDFCALSGRNPWRPPAARFDADILALGSSDEYGDGGSALGVCDSGRGSWDDLGSDCDAGLENLGLVSVIVYEPWCL